MRKCSFENNLLSYLLLITLVRKLHVDIAVFAYLRDDSSFAAYNFGVIFGVY